MSEENYSIKEVIESKFNEMNEHLVEIKTEVKRTNGRVTKLELWQKLIIGGSIGIWAVIMLVGGIFVKLYIKDVARQSALEVVGEFNSQYNIKINNE